MSHTHDEGNPGAETCHKAAPMVEEITDYEILEIAVRELAIEHGLFRLGARLRLGSFSPRRIIAGSGSLPNRSDQLGVLDWSRRHGPTPITRPVSWRTAPQPAGRLRSIGQNRRDPALQAITWSFTCLKIRRPCTM